MMSCAFSPPIYPKLLSAINPSKATVILSTSYHIEIHFPPRINALDSPNKINFIHNQASMSLIIMFAIQFITQHPVSINSLPIKNNISLPLQCLKEIYYNYTNIIYFFIDSFRAKLSMPSLPHPPQSDSNDL